MTMPEATDPKMQGAPIVRATACRRGHHAFKWPSANSLRSEPRNNASCFCGKYRWDEWEIIQQTARIATEVAGKIT